MRSSEFSLVFVAGNRVEPELLEKYKTIYNHWHTIWSATFQEIDEGDGLFSDQFTRQDEILALFHNDVCVAVCCHRLVDMRMPSFKKDSYFEPWTDYALQRLRKNGDKVIIDSQVSVDPKFRKMQNGMKFIDLMAYVSFLHLSRLQISSITAASRNLRSMDSVFEKFGPEHLEKDVLYHGESTSLYALFPEQITFDNVSAELRTFGDDLLLRPVRSKLIDPFFMTLKGESNVKKFTPRAA